MKIKESGLLIYNRLLILNLLCREIELQLRCNVFPGFNLPWQKKSKFFFIDFFIKHIASLLLLLNIYSTEL